ncbi:MAG: hypothetical protein QM770_03470 [Tepidisphaeraceae bacterium]
MRRALVVTSVVLCLAVLTDAQTPPAPTSQPVQPISVPVHYKDQSVVIVSEAGVAAFGFTDLALEGEKYTWRFRPADGSAEQRGDGEVYENYEQMKQPDGTVKVIDHGSKLTLEAGPMSLPWSQGDEQRGWLYFRPEQVRVYLIDSAKFDQLDLVRFAK